MADFVMWQSAKKSRLSGIWTNLNILSSSVTVIGTCDDSVFDERELKFEIGDGESFGLPAGVEKAIMAMEQGEEAVFTIKPKYVHMCKFLPLIS